MKLNVCNGFVKKGTVGLTKKGLLYRQLFVEMLPNFIQFPLLLKKKENSNTRRLRKIFLASGEKESSSSSDALTTELLEL